jgi:hypothetical protein
MTIPAKDAIPLPPAGGEQAINRVADTVFNWRYDVRSPELLALLREGESDSSECGDGHRLVDRRSTRSGFRISSPPSRSTPS